MIVGHVETLQPLPNAFLVKRVPANIQRLLGEKWKEGTWAKTKLVVSTHLHGN